MSRRHVVVVGDVLLDRDLVGRVERLCPDAPVPVVDVERRSGGPGGAGLTALLCRTPQTEVTLVTALADDAAGAQLRDALSVAGVRVVALPHAGPTRVKTRVRRDDESLLRFDEGGPGTPTGPLTAHAAEALDAADVVVVSCYGAGMTAHPGIRSALREVAGRTAVLWDPHPAGAPPVGGVTVVTPNLAEARTLSGLPAATPGEAARALLQRWDTTSVCVTSGRSGAWLAGADASVRHIPAVPAHGDSCGAGDRFVAAMATAVAAGLALHEATALAVQEASRWVADGGTSGFRSRQDDQSPGEPSASEASAGEADPGEATPRSTTAAAHQIRSGTGTLVATGGCFDVLHAGHIACLEAARARGDRLVVLLNSDSSVRRLKGPGRPVQPAADRTRVLLGLQCVDHVLEFAEDTPERLLDALRPDVWVKGGDYRPEDLPEAALLRQWGGRVETCPYLAGRSTTRILTRAR